MNTESKFTKGQEVWVKARIGEDPNPDRDGEIEVHINRGWDTDDLSFALPSDIRTTEQILQEHGASDPQTKSAEYTPDFANTLKAGDTVKLVERWGRRPSKLEFMGALGFKLNGTYIVEESEDYEYDVRITNGNEYYYVPFIFLDLVEPAPKYKLVENTREYQIYDTQKRQTKASFSNEIYTFEEVQAECDRLNQKDQDND